MKHNDNLPPGTLSKDIDYSDLCEQCQSSPATTQYNTVMLCSDCCEEIINKEQEEKEIE